MSDQTDSILQEILAELRKMNEYTVHLNTNIKHRPTNIVSGDHQAHVYPFGRQP